jgi:hypothetical protein
MAEEVHAGIPFIDRVIKIVNVSQQALPFPGKAAHRLRQIVCFV